MQDKARSHPEKLAFPYLAKKSLKQKQQQKKNLGVHLLKSCICERVTIDNEINSLGRKSMVERLMKVAEYQVI